MTHVAPPMIEYRLTFDEQFVVGTANAHRRQRQVYPWFIAVKAFCALGLTLLIALVALVAYAAFRVNGAAVPMGTTTLVLLALLVALFLGPRIDHVLLKRRLRRSSFYGDTFCIRVNDAGVSVVTPRSESTLQWSAFTEARRVTTGFLVFTSPTEFSWWADAALVSGTVEDVSQILEARLGGRHGGSRPPSPGGPVKPRHGDG